MYDFLWEFVSTVYLEPQKLGLPTDEDNWYGDGELNKSNPQLVPFSAHEKTDSVLI